MDGALWKQSLSCWGYRGRAPRKRGVRGSRGRGHKGSKDVVSAETPIGSSGAGVPSRCPVQPLQAPWSCVGWRGGADVVG